MDARRKAIIDKQFIHDMNPNEWDDSAANEPTEHMGGACPCYGCELCNPDDDYYRGEGDLEC